MRRLKISDAETDRMKKRQFNLQKKTKYYKKQIIIKEEGYKNAHKGEKSPFTRSITNYNLKIKNNKVSILVLKESLKNKNIQIILYI